MLENSFSKQWKQMSEKEKYEYKFQYFVRILWNKANNIIHNFEEKENIKISEISVKNKEKIEILINLLKIEAFVILNDVTKNSNK